MSKIMKNQCEIKFDALIAKDETWISETGTQFNKDEYKTILSKNRQ